jgi:hypothetical protein
MPARFVRQLLSGGALLLLAACGRDQDPVSAPLAIWRPVPRWDQRRSDGDGSIGWVISGTLAAFQERTYACVVTGGPLKGGKLVEHRHFYVGAGDTATITEILLLNDRLVTQSVKYADQAGRRRIVTENRRHPLIPNSSDEGLMGADTLATRLFSAAAAAPCPYPEAADAP